MPNSCMEYLYTDCGSEQNNHRRKGHVSLTRSVMHKKNKGGNMKLSRLSALFLLLGILLLSSCAGTSSYMKPADTLLNPSDDTAVVRFMRPGGIVGAVTNYNVLDGEKVIGNVPNKTQLDYLAKPGKHLFIVSFSRWKYFLEAELEPQKVYYVIVSPGVGVAAVNRESKYWDKVKKYEDTLVKLRPDVELAKAWEEANKPKIQKLIRHYELDWKGKKEMPKLNPEDGR